MADVIKPCPCGHKGELHGTHNGVWHELKCPACDRKVEAFTATGLIENWNKARETKDDRQAP